MKVCSALLAFAVFYTTLAAPLPQQHQSGTDPFSNLARSFNAMAANTFSTAANQQATAFQQAQQRPGNGRVVSTSVSSSGSGAQVASTSTHSIGTGWQQVSASASAHSNSNNQRRRTNQTLTTRSTRPSRRPNVSKSTGRPVGQSN